MQLSIVGIANCCSSNINIDNAFVSCSTNNVSCNAECYRGYIFTNGSTKENYSCQNGAWRPMSSSCKQIPLVSVTYSAIWVFDEVVISVCANISSRLDNLREVLEETLAKNCQMLNINATVQFTHSFLAFQVHTHFKAVYDNFTNWKALNVCIHYNLGTFRNHQVIKSMFEGVTCGNLNTSNTIHRDLFVREIYDTCPSATELFNVSTSEDGMYIRYCD
uniref:Sushi domain-containing protein n=1 Tax=Magallana gigas TaxID=29159 RepID=A0A8W8JH20_MAGGI